MITKTKHINEPIAAGTNLLEDVLSAHGGTDIFKKFSKVSTSGRLGGWLFLRTPLRRNFQPFTRGPSISIKSEMEVSLNSSNVILQRFPQEGYKGIYDGKRAVILDAEGNVAESRIIDVEDFSKKFFWDKLNTLYFLGYVASYYFQSPFIFGREDFQTYELPPVFEFENEFRCLQVIHPEGFNSHTRKINYYIDKNGLINHFRYTIDISKDDMKFIQFLSDYTDVSGYKFPKRRVIFLENEPLVNFRRKSSIPMAGNQAYTHKIELLP